MEPYIARLVTITGVVLGFPPFHRAVFGIPFMEQRRAADDDRASPSQQRVKYPKHTLDQAAGNDLRLLNLAGDSRL